MAQTHAPKKAKHPIMLAPFGSAFCLNEVADYLTAAHVLFDDIGDARPQPTIVPHLIGFGGDGVTAHVVALDRDLDLAVLRVPPKPLPPHVRFSSNAVLPMGHPVGSIGYPIPVASFGEEAAQFELTRRFSAGFISGGFAQLSLWNKGPKVPVYEANLLSYHGNSGGPLFDLSGNIVGLCRGTILHQGAVAAFAVSVRNTEIIAFLEKHSIQFHFAAF